MKRIYSALLNEYLSFFPCVAIVGPRQCGKTTLIQELPYNWKRFDLEKTSDFQTISRDSDLFLRLNPECVALDEAQLLPEIFAALRVAIDKNRSQKGRFVITGSSSPQLLRSVSETLAGRVGMIEMAPFSMAEAFQLPESPFFSGLAEKSGLGGLKDHLSARLDIRQAHDYWFRGGYPEPWLQNDPRFTEVWMDQYVRTYIQRDIARLFPGLNQNRFQLFIQLLASLSNTIINYSDVARSLGVSQPTVRDYFEIAHGSFLWRNVPPYEKKATKRIVKHPRGFLRDSGLLHHLLRLRDLDHLLAYPTMGRSWEAMVAEQILRGMSARGIPHDYYYYRTAAGAEVDLVLEGAFGVLPIEIKYAQNVHPRPWRAIMDFIEERKCPFGLVITNEESVRLYHEKLLGVPFTAL